MVGDQRTLRRYLASSINVVVQVDRMADGRRRVTSIAEVTGLEGESIVLNELFDFAEDPPLSGRGEFRRLTLRPRFEGRLTGARELQASLAARL